MKKSYSRIFEIDDQRFLFAENPNYRYNKICAKFRLMKYDDIFGWMTINYPRNITEAKQMAKQYLIYSWDFFSRTIAKEKALLRELF